MKCVKCEEGELKKIKFIKSGQVAYACDYCETYWLEGDLIKYNTGHTLNPYHPIDDYEYPVQDLDKKDQDHQPIRKVRIV